MDRMIWATCGIISAAVLAIVMSGHRPPEAPRMAQTGAFTDSNGLNRTTDNALMICARVVFIEGRKIQIGHPDAVDMTPQQIYRLCMLSTGVVI